MRRPVIAIGLDAAAWSLVGRWMAEGRLPVLAGLRAQGTYAPIRSHAHHTAETPWTMFHTGVTPPALGYWSPIQFREGTYEVQREGAYDYQEFPPFYALGDDYRIAVFDAPQTRLSDKVNGIQVLDWGAHSAQTSAESIPSGLLSELTAVHGAYPARGESVSIYDSDALLRLKANLEVGIARRSAICQDLLQRDRWDLFLTVFGCFHTAGHRFWHMSDPDHPLYAASSADARQEPLRDVFVAADRAIGEIIAKASPDASVVIFSTHGMEANVLDLGSMVFLPELLYRFSFPGRVAMAPGRSGAEPPPPVSGRRLVDESWPRVLWSLIEEGGATKSFIKRTLPHRYSRRIERLFPKPADTEPSSPFRSGKSKWLNRAQPATWFQRLWPRMKAFALPSFSQGYIRINLEGREPGGIVPASEYDCVCEELIGLLSRVTDARTGQPVVHDVIRTRRSPDARDPRLPAPDLVVRWRAQRPADVVDSPLGRIGPVPFSRSGGHNPNGFLLARGPGIPIGASLPEGRTVDLAPTILHLMSAPISGRLEGRPLILTSGRTPQSSASGAPDRTPVVI